MLRTLLISVLMTTPVAAEICRFDQLCTGTDACEPAPDDAFLQLQLSQDTAEITIDGQTGIFTRIAPKIEGVESFLGSDPGGSGTILLSLHEGGEITMTIHGRIFGPFVVTGHGSCAGIAE